MRRAATITALGALAALVIVLFTTASGAQIYKVAAVFDTADQIVPGSQVKIAGAVVGSVSAVQLVRGPAARIVMSVDPRFRPFRADAACTILPEGLVSENYVECQPGVSSQLLGSPGGSAATVPLAHTTVPLSLQQLINVFTMPTDERISVMLAELGISFAGRGQDLNGLLLRSNPALAQAQRALGILAAQRRELADGIRQTNTVLAALATNTHSVREFVDKSAAASAISAAHAGPLAQSIARFPPLLQALRPSLVALENAALAGTTVLSGLRAAAPQLDELNSTLPPFLRAGLRSLPSLSAVSRTGLATIRTSRTVVSDLDRSATSTIPFARDANRTFISIRDEGGNEAFLRFWYSLATAESGYDQTSHFQSAYLTFFSQCMQNPPAAGCSYAFDAPGAGTIPVNDPACGPQSDAPWAPATNCVAQPPAGAIRHGRAQPRGLASAGAAARSSTSTPTTSPAGTVGSANSKLDSILRAVVPTTPTTTRTPASVGALLHYLLDR